MVGNSSSHKRKAPAGVRRLCFWSLGGKLPISTLRLAATRGDENRVGTVEELICFGLSLTEKQGSYSCRFSNTSAKNVRTASRPWFTVTRKQAALSAKAQNWRLSFRSLLCRPSLDRPSPLPDRAEAAAIPAVQGRARWAISIECTGGWSVVPSGLSIYPASSTAELSWVALGVALTPLLPAHFITAPPHVPISCAAVDIFLCPKEFSLCSVQATAGGGNTLVPKDAETRVSFQNHGSAAESHQS